MATNTVDPLAQPPPYNPPAPQAGYAPPPQGYAPMQPAYVQPIMMAPPPQQQQQQQQSTVVVTNMGGSDSCKHLSVSEDFTGCGICLAIFFFPLGLLCCFLMRERHCRKCGARM